MFQVAPVIQSFASKQTQDFSGDTSKRCNRSIWIAWLPSLFYVIMRWNNCIDEFGSTMWSVDHQMLKVSFGSLHLRDSSTGGAMTARRRSLGHHINEMCQIIIRQIQCFVPLMEQRWSYELCLQGAIYFYSFFFSLNFNLPNNLHSPTENWIQNLKLSLLKLKQRLLIAVTHSNGFHSNMSLNLMRLWFKRCKLLKEFLNQERV